LKVSEVGEIGGGVRTMRGRVTTERIGSIASIDRDKEREKSMCSDMEEVEAARAVQEIK